MLMLLLKLRIRYDILNLNGPVDDPIITGSNPANDTSYIRIII